LESLLRAILNDDRGTVKTLLARDTGLAHRLVDKPRLYDSKILHWIYAGDTALHLASAGYRIEIMQTLLGAGANPNAASNHRQSSPLHYAADGNPGLPGWDAGKQVQAIRCLLRAGANIHAQDKNGATALHRAVRTRCVDAVRCLLQEGSDPTLKNRPGSTPFHLAVQNTGRGGSGAAEAITAQREIIKEFLALGVRPTLKSAAGKSVMDCAQSDWIRQALTE
jgi:hypothetical protein